METKFTVTLDDFVAFNLHVYQKVGTGRVRVSTLLFVLGGGYLTFLAATTGHAVWAVFLGAFTVGYAALSPTLARLSTARAVRRFVATQGGTGIVGPVTAILSDESLTWVSEVQRSETRWEKVIALEETCDHLFILVTPASAAIIPRSAFARHEDFVATRDFVRAKIRPT
jgi:hypothetical protein